MGGHTHTHTHTSFSIQHVVNQGESKKLQLMLATPPQPWPPPLPDQIHEASVLGGGRLINDCVIVKVAPPLLQLSIGESPQLGKRLQPPPRGCSVAQPPRAPPSAGFTAVKSRVITRFGENKSHSGFPRLTQLCMKLCCKEKGIGFFCLLYQTFLLK